MLSIPRSDAVFGSGRPQNVVVELTVEEEYFTTDLTTANGTYAEGTTIKTGHAKIRVTHKHTTGMVAL